MILYSHLRRNGAILSESKPRFQDGAEGFWWVFMKYLKLFLNMFFILFRMYGKLMKCLKAKCPGKCLDLKSMKWTS